MSYQVLARKWRPKQFTDMVGQESILRMLGNALEQKRLHHAYLFTGTRGVGKTTIARILARCLNCETGITANPCGQCGNCKAIDAGQFLDLYEVDAASRTKVEDTRELLDNVLYPPTQGRYKIYLIDEVHMLSNHSFNALLKTLEEPPEHVKFLLATTDPKKLPVTILSRCLQFHLKRITPEFITNHLNHICQIENITHDGKALSHLAKAADGSMRDALSLLDQAIAYGHGSVKEQEVHAMLGSMAQEDLLPLLNALATSDGPTLFSAAQQLAERSPDFQQVLETIISLFHQLAIAQIVPEQAKEDIIITLANQFQPEDIQIYYQIALMGRRDLALAPSPQQGFEMTLLRMLAFKPSLGQPNTIEKVSNNIEPIKANPITPITIPANKPLPVTAPFSVGKEWIDILPKLELSGMAQALAANCTLTQLTENKVELAVAQSHQPMLNAKLKERIAESLTRYLGKPIQLEINTTTDVLHTPVKQAAQERNQRLEQAKHNVMQDDKIKQLIAMYDATVEVSLAN